MGREAVIGADDVGKNEHSIMALVGVQICPNLAPGIGWDVTGKFLAR